ncbi:MAG: DUF58 domain-containing protein [Planctomycetaceae bacterium]|jgi:uncharacterized protein (DUF58 family)|nr:DUF58 domain-containing protein [Planctomycetaceae bacterium]
MTVPALVNLFFYSQNLFAVDFFDIDEGVTFDRRVLLIFPAAVLAFLLPALFRRVFPTRRLFGLLIVPTVFSVTLYCNRDFFPFWGGWELSTVFLRFLLVLDSAIILVLAYDFFLTLPIFEQPFRVERQLERIASLSRPHLVRLRLENHSRFRYRLLIRDDVPASLAPEPETFSERIMPRRSAETLEYDVNPTERGLFPFEKVALQIRSRFGFWRRYITLSCQSEICVYPNLRQMTEYDLLARADRLHQLGVRTARRVGHDNDFERLRDYQLDDQYKFIDWTATARRQKLTVKDFQMSRSQRIMFLVDCGRMMTNFCGSKLTLLDHSLNAALMLSYVAIRRFDAVGMLCFSNRIINYIPPATGQRQINRMLHGFFNLYAEPVESRYDEAFSYLASRCRKRSLVILITNVADQVNARTIQNHLTHLTGRHLPLGVFLRDHQMFDPLRNFFGTLDACHQPGTKLTSSQLLARNEDNSVTTETLFAKTDDYWRAGAAAEILNWRHKVINDLKHQGTLTLDLFPEEMTAPLINKYLEVKARHLL